MMTTRHGQVRHQGERGHAVIETAFLAPWIFLLFVGIVDAGFYFYAAISTANAARVAAFYTSSSPDTLDDSLGACAAAIAEMRPLPNIKSTVNCPEACAAGAACMAGPMIVTATRLDAAASPDGAAAATEVSVRYQTVDLFPIPGLAGKLDITRTARVRQRM